MNACARTLAAYLLGESSDAIASEEGYERGVTLVKVSGLRKRLHPIFVFSFGWFEGRECQG